MKRIETVVFDLGGVLIDWEPRNLYRKLFAGDEAGMERFLAEVCNYEFNQGPDTGRTYAECVLEAQSRWPQHADLIGAHDLRWEEMLGDRPLAIPVFRRLKTAGMPLYSLTNFSSEKWQVALKRYDFLAEFDGIVVSAHEGAVKPSPAIYRVLLDRYGIDPATSLFIDDRQENVDAARAIGMNAIRFANERRLEWGLADFGLAAAAGPVR